MSFSLQSAKLCLSCEIIFAGGNEHCIACGSTQWVWLSRYIKPLKEAKEKVEKDANKKSGS